MSSPTRVITPRLEAALTAGVQFLDTLVSEEEYFGAYSPTHGARIKQLRAELLEAFEEARKG